MDYLLSVWLHFHYHLTTYVCDCPVYLQYSQGGICVKIFSTAISSMSVELDGMAFFFSESIT